MKAVQVIFFLLSLIWSLSSLALVLTSDKSEYILGEKVVLISAVEESAPAAHLEYYAEYLINNSGQKVTQLSEEYFGAVVSGLSAGSYTWITNIYTQDKALAQSLKNQILSLNQEIVKIKSLKVRETNSDKLADLNAAQNNVEQLILGVRAQLISGRTLFMTESKNFSVVPAYLRAQSYEDSINIQAYTTTVVAGQSIGFGMDIDPSEFDSHQGYSVDTTIAEKYVIFNQAALPHTYWYYFQTSSQDEGTKQFEAKLYLFDSQADIFITSALNKTSVRKIQMELARDTAVNPSLRSYFEAEVQDLDAILSLLYSAHSDMKQLAVTKTIQFDVVEPLPVTLSLTNLQVVEGQVVSYQVTVNKAPVGAATITVSSPSADLQFWKTGGAPASTVSLVFTELNWQTPQTVNVTAPDNQVSDGVRNTQISHTVTGAGFESVIVPDLPTSLSDPHVPLVCSPAHLYTYDYNFESYSVSLPHQPSAPVEVLIDSNGVYDLNGSLSTYLYFDENNWDIPQTVDVYISEQVSGMYSITNVPSGDSSISGCAVTAEHTGMSKKK